MKKNYCYLMNLYVSVHATSRLLTCLFEQECKPKLCGFGPVSNGMDTDLNKLYKFAQNPSAYVHPSTIRGTEFGVNTSEQINNLQEVS